MKWKSNSIPSLSRYLDTELTAEVVEGEPSGRDHQLFATFTLPTEDYNNLTANKLNSLYLQPLVKAMAEKINAMGKVRTGSVPLPKDMVAFLCEKGKIPVTLVVVRKSSPDRHQFIISILVEPVNEA